jgi:hypothetical protein
MKDSNISQISRKSLQQPVSKPSSEVCNPAVAFFFAWKKGVELAGTRFFGDGSQEGFTNANCRWDLRPNIRVISCSFEVLSGQERMFLAALVSFFNTGEGNNLLKQSGMKGLSDLGLLNVEQRDVLAGLIMHNHDW